MRLPAWFVRLTTVSPDYVVACCLASILMTGCAATPEMPPWFDAILRFPVKTASVNGHRLAYLDHGQGPPLILIHGYGGSMWQWEYQQLPLSAAYRVITPDLIGSGLSDKPDIDYRPEELIESVRGLMEALDLPTATLVGNSMGGGVAIGMALTHPELVDRLVLIDGLPDHIRERLVSPLMRRAIDTHVPVWLARVGSWLFGNRTMETVLREIVYDQTLLTPAVLDRSNRNRRRADMIAPLLSIRDSLPRWEQDYATRLKEIRHPTLILWGEHDRLFPPQVGRDLQSAIPQSRLIVIPRAGHIPQWEQPQVVNRHLIDFLQP
ncbi:MAG: Hydrolase, alpha/beta fold family [Nitrospira sp.]|nr:MAG: Hydrolase, alpha/beta fold family [Nitrospira sp.]